MRLTLLALVLLAAVARVVANTITDDSPVPPVGALGGPSIALDDVQLERWKRGRRLFDRDMKPEDGLGRPDLNGDSCRACHQDPVIGGAAGLDLNVFRFGRDDDGRQPLHGSSGRQIGSRLRNPLVPGREDHDPRADVFETRNPTSLFGLNLIDGIPEHAILAQEDPDDADGDGIRGVARQVDVGGRREVGRLGWKAQIPRLEDFLHDALGEELGLTTVDNGRGFGVFADADGVPDPEFAGQDFDDLLFYLQHLAPPPRRGSTDPAVAWGETLFTHVGCATCHVPSLPGADGPVPLYSNLLLHNIHPADFRGVAEPGAGVGLYRTPPLWGVRHTAPYLHDGRAETLEAAILAHHGEAARVRAAYVALPATDRKALLAFLEDL